MNEDKETTHMGNPLEYWTNKHLDERNASLVITAERQEEILADVDGMDARQGYEYEKTLRLPAQERLREAVLADIRRRDATPSGHGWDDARTVTVATDPHGFSSFRRSHAALIEMIAIDYDGYADERTRQGDARGLASLAKELAEMAILAYANIPSLYYPMQIENGCWVIDDIMSRSHQARIRVPVSAFMPKRLADEIADEIHSSNSTNALAMQWWSMFLQARADETNKGLLVPLPEVVTVPRRNEQDAYDEEVTTDGDIMMVCADVIRYWESVKNDVVTMADTEDAPSLCAVIDEIVRLVTRR